MNQYRDYDNYLKEYPTKDGYFGRYGGNYLDDPDVDQVILMPNEDTSQNTLDVDIDLNVPEGKTLTTEEGVYVDVNSGKSATVNGTAELGDTLTNNGLVTVNSSNTLKVNSDVRNYGSFVNTEAGRTIVGGKFIGSGDSAFENRGEYEGLVSGEGMHLLNRGIMQGEVFGYFQTMKSCRLLPLGLPCQHSNPEGTFSSLALLRSDLIVDSL